MSINNLIGGGRRRLMMACSKKEEIFIPTDGKLWCYCTIDEAGTYRISDGNDAWAQLEIDDQIVSSIYRDQYLSAGDHLIKFTLRNPTVLNAILRGIRLYSKVLVSDTVTTISDYCFYATDSANCTVVMDKTKITSIGTAAFFHSIFFFGDFDFPNLTSLGQLGDYYGIGRIKIKNLGSITSIPDSCFRGGTPIDKTFRLPATVTSIGSLAFYINSYDVIFICYATTPPTLGSQWVFRSPAAIYVPAGSVQAYQEAAGWSTYANKIQAIPE